VITRVNFIKSQNVKEQNHLISIVSAESSSSGATGEATVGGTTSATVGSSISRSKYGGKTMYGVELSYATKKEVGENCVVLISGLIGSSSAADRW
jgi:hypothetical protein